MITLLSFYTAAIIYSILTLQSNIKWQNETHLVRSTSKSVKTIEKCIILSGNLVLHLRIYLYLLLQLHQTYSLCWLRGGGGQKLFSRAASIFKSVPILNYDWKCLFNGKKYFNDIPGLNGRSLVLVNIWTGFAQNSYG